MEAINESINYPKIRLFSAGLDCSVFPRRELCKIELPWSVASPGINHAVKIGKENLQRVD